MHTKYHITQSGFHPSFWHVECYTRVSARCATHIIDDMGNLTPLDFAAVAPSVAGATH